MLIFLVSALFVIICLLLLLVVLLQQGRGGDIASAFGGSSSQVAFGARSGATVLTRATTVLAVLFMLTAIALSILIERGPSSVVGSGRVPASAPAQQGSTPRQNAPAPAQQPAPAKPPAPQPK